MLLHSLPWEIKNSNFLQKFSRHGRKSKQIDFVCTDEYPSPVIFHGVLCVCGLSSWLKTKSLIVSTFSSVQALCGLPLPGRRSTVAVPRNFFNSLLTPCFVQLFWRNSSVHVCSVYPSNTNFFYQNLVLIAEYHVYFCKHCSKSQCCDEFPVPQINRKHK